MLKYKAQAKLSPQRQAAESLLQQLKPTLETETGRGNITITHYLQARGSQSEEDYRPQSVPGTGFYSLDDVVATGGMGAILRAFDNNLQRQVALKVMLNSADAPEDSLYSFVAEAQITGQLEHPNIVPLHDIGVAADGTVYYTMKLIEGRTLREILKEIRDGNPETIERFPLSRLLTVFQKVCDGIAYAHSRNVIHRDLKPDNVMVGGFGEVLILDWGLAKVIGTAEASSGPEGSEFTGGVPDGAGAYGTLAGQVKGTPNYMAPEQAEGRVQDLDARTDIYALGGILYAILTLHPPITGANLDEILTRVTSSQITPPLDYNKLQVENPTGLPAPHCPEGRIPSALSAVAMKCMAYDSDHRYPMVEMLQGDIAAFQGGYATMAEDAGLFTQLRLLMARNKKEVFFILLLIAAVIGTGVAFIGRVRYSAWQADQARKEAEAKIQELRKSAPAFHRVALGYINERLFDKALEAVNYAIQLDDKQGDFYNTKGNIFQTQLKLAEARAEYQRAYDLLPNHPQANANKSVCASILARDTEPGKLSNQSLRDLHGLMVRQDRIAEAFVISQLLAKQDSGVIDEWRENLKRANLVGTLSRDENGFHVDLSGSTSSSIAALKGIPLITIKLAGCFNLTDIAVLEEMKLIEELDVSGTKIRDLGPLKGHKLQKLNLAGCSAITDLAPLQGMQSLAWMDLSDTGLGEAGLGPLQGIPLKYLNLQNTGIRDLEPLKGMPLTWLKLDKSKAIDFGPLSSSPLDYLSANECSIRSIYALTNCPLREELHLNRTLVRDLTPLKGKRTKVLQLYKAPVSNLAPLENMPLQNLDLSWTPVTDIGPLNGMPLDTLLLLETQVSDISPLKDAPLTKELNLAGTKVTDLTPLRGAPLQNLVLSRTAVQSVKPLENMPLRILRLDECETQPDLNPLWSCQNLEFLAVPFPSPTMVALRQLPKLQRLTYRLLRDDWNAATTPQQFWKAWDSRNR